MLKKILKVLGIILAVLIVALGVLRYLLNDQITVMNAVIDEDKDTLAYYIDEKGFNPNDLYGWFNLYNVYTLEKKQASKIDFIEYMLNLKIDPNYDKGRVPILSYAIVYDKIDLVILLISHGADVNFKDKKKLTPLGTALRLSNCEIAKLLIDNGAVLTGDKKAKNLERDRMRCEQNNWISAQKRVME